MSRKVGVQLTKFLRIRAKEYERTRNQMHAPVAAAVNANCACEDAAGSEE